MDKNEALIKDLKKNRGNQRNYLENEERFRTKWRSRIVQTNETQKRDSPNDRKQKNTNDRKDFQRWSFTRVMRKKTLEMSPSKMLGN